MISVPNCGAIVFVTDCMQGIHTHLIQLKDVLFPIPQESIRDFNIFNFSRRYEFICFLYAVLCRFFNKKF